MIIGPRRSPRRSPAARRGFTLIELLVVILIIMLVSAVALPAVLPALNNRQLSEAGRILQGALVGARDKAVHDGAPSGIRLLPDPAFPLSWTTAGTIDPTQPLVYNRIVPIGPAPEYNEGLVTTVPVMAVQAQAGGASPSPVTIAPGVVFSWPSMPTNLVPALVLVESPADPSTGLVNSPTSWFWNVRVGDKIQIGGAGPWYTIVGPAMNQPVAGNSEYFTNMGAPGPVSGQAVPQINGTAVEYLLLTNGRDDGPMGAMGNPDGWIDSGWDGVDNNGNGKLDEYAEWENEAWLGGGATGALVNVPYAIRRRPAPLPGAREVSLPTGMVVDATTWANGTSSERSRLPVDRYSGIVEILLNPDGTVLYNSPYATPSSFGMGDAFYHFWLADRGDVMPPDVTNQTSVPYLPTPPGVTPGRFASGAEIKGHYSILTLFARTGQIAVNEMPPFLFDSSLGYNSQTGTYNPNNPFIPAEQGIRGAP